MVAVGKCEECRTIPANHCYGSGDRPAKDGKIGGFRCTCPCRNEASSKNEEER